MLMWSDFEVAKGIHKEREQAAQEGWQLRQAFATVGEAISFSLRLRRWLHSLQFGFGKAQDEQQIVCC